MNDFFETWAKNESYFNALKVFSGLSNLFAAPNPRAPYLDYRIAENLFCKFFSAKNYARECTAYDARIGSTGIGIKTFILKSANELSSLEKIAEFDRLSAELSSLRDNKDLARKVAEYRNERIASADAIYGTKKRTYHIIGRKKDQLCIFNSPYDPIDIDKIRILSRGDQRATLWFSDGKHEYSYNFAKSVLLQKFWVPEKGVKEISVEILTDPIACLLRLLKDENFLQKAPPPLSYVVLPLYSTKDGSVPEKSELNQWNAAGRKRSPDEVYIPIPKAVHDAHQDFFPPRNEPFVLELPDGQKLDAKVCQANGKALMSNPNARLGEWMLRKILRKKEGNLVTRRDLDILGIDSVKVERMPKTSSDGQKIYRLSFAPGEYENYSEFIR